jgi:hypothetical protein
LVDVRKRDKAVVRRVAIDVIFGKWRLLLRMALVGENQPITFESKIRTMANALAGLAVFGLGRHVKNLPVDVMDPDVLAATDALVLNNAELERCAAVAALAVQHTDTTGAIAKRNVILAQDADRFWHVREFFCKTDWMPESAHLFAHRRCWPDLRQFRIVTGLRGIRGF